MHRTSCSEQAVFYLYQPRTASCIFDAFVILSEVSACKDSFQRPEFLLIVLALFKFMHSELMPEILSLNMAALKLKAKLGLRKVNNLVRLRKIA